MRDWSTALVSGDPGAADAAMRAHVRYGLAEITANFSALAASEWRERRKQERGDPAVTARRGRAASR